MTKRESTSGISRLLASLKEQAEINEAEELNSELQSKQSAVPEITAPHNTAVKFTAVKPGAPIDSAVSKNGAAKQLAASDITAPNNTAAENGAAISEAPPDFGAPIIEAATKNGAPENGTAPFDDTLSPVLELLDHIYPYILTNTELNNTEKVILLYLFETSLKSHYLIPISYRELQAETGIKSLNTVIKTIKRLETLGFLDYNKGKNKSIESRADIRGLYRKVIVDLELSIQVTDFINAWYTKIYCSNNYSSRALLCMYVLNKYKKQNIQNQDLIVNGAAKNAAVNSEDLVQTIRASSGDTLETVVTYALARGFDSRKISAAFLDYLLRELESIGGTFQERLSALKDFEMKFLVAVEYTKDKKDTKKPWNYTVSCVKNDYSSASDTIEIRNRVEKHRDLIAKYVSKPDEIEFLGLEELSSLASVFNLKIEKNPKAVVSFRHKLKDKIREIKEEFNLIIQKFGINIDSRSNELISR
ncbi:MAG TPA: hypothetical protein PK411_14705 [Mesotoga infera]|jgi:hypothetical protein|nr:hypothetical protein [Mesotoga infera]